MSCSSFDSDWKAYVLRELDADAARQAEAHLATCSICHEEVATLRLTLGTLATLRDEEMPRRIAFVSDKVFEPRWWQRVFNPTFAAGCLVAVAIVAHGAMRTAPDQQDQVNAAVAKAVSQAVSQVEARHMQEIRAMFEQVDVRNQAINNMYLSNASLVRH